MFSCLLKNLLQSLKISLNGLWKTYIYSFVKLDKSFESLQLLCFLLFCGFIMQCRQALLATLLILWLPVSVSFSNPLKVMIIWILFGILSWVWLEMKKNILNGVGHRIHAVQYSVLLLIYLFLFSQYITLFCDFLIYKYYILRRVRCKQSSTYRKQDIFSSESSFLS